MPETPMCSNKGRGWACDRPAVHQDHIHPVFAGGPDISANLRWLCRVCHEMKNASESRMMAFYRDGKPANRRYTDGALVYWDPAKREVVVELADWVFAP